MDPLASLYIPPFVPHPLLASGHVQTSLVPYLRHPAMDRGERVEVAIEGGALIGRLHRASPASRACALVLHGIGGTADEPFVMRTVRLLNERGVDALRLHLRGAGESAACGVAPLFHAGLTGDVRAALELLTARYERVHAVGFSLGGQLVLRALGEWGAATPGALASATAISPPVDLSDGAIFAGRPEAYVYRTFIVRTLKARYLAARAVMGAEFTEATVRDVRSIRDYDAAVVAPFFGFRDVEDYYARANSAALLHEIRVPTLIVHAADDPLVPIEPVRRVAARGLARVRVVETARGGHVGFLAARVATGDTTRYWAEERAADLCAAASR